MNKKIIKIIVSIVILIMGISLIGFTYFKFINVKKYKLITKDTVFLCPVDEYRDGIVVVVKKDEGK